MSAALLGSIVAMVAVGFVLWPLFVAPRPSHGAPADQSMAGDAALRALAELEFDRATGLLNGADYDRLKAVYTARVSTLKAAPSAPGEPAVDPPVDDAEALIAAVRGGSRACAACGAVCPEPDAAFCSTCGASLAAD